MVNLTNYNLNIMKQKDYYYSIIYEMNKSFMNIEFT